MGFVRDLVSRHSVVIGGSRSSFSKCDQGNESKRILPVNLRKLTSTSYENRRGPTTQSIIITYTLVEYMVEGRLLRGKCVEHPWEGPCRSFETHRLRRGACRPC